MRDGINSGVGEPRSYYYLADISAAWARDRRQRDSSKIQRALHTAFWLGEFENLSDDNPKGTILGADHFISGEHLTHDWIGQPFGRHDMLHGVLGTISGLPHHGRWAPDGKDPSGDQWLEDTKIKDRSFPDDLLYKELSRAPISTYPPLAQEFLNNLALKPPVIEAWFERRGWLVPHAVGLLISSGEIPSPRELARSLPPKPKARFSDTKARRAYKDWVAENEAAGKRSTADEDLAAIRKAVNAEVPRDYVRALRRELAPTSWKKRGRRKPTKN